MDSDKIRPEWVPSGYKEIAKAEQMGNTNNNKTKFNLNTCKGILCGVAVGDALGVPVEFNSRDEISKQPVTDMIGYGTHDKPPGTFSDDSSLTFCLAESIASGFTLESAARNFINWRYDSYWTADNEVFDVGMTTQRAIDRLVKGTRPDLAGDFEEESNGNGSLMRILPLLVYIRDKPVSERFQLIKQVSSITHGHVRSAIACFYYLEFALGLLNGEEKFNIYHNLQKDVAEYLRLININRDERNLFDRLLIDRIDMIPENQIRSSGYVVHTLEASIWCLLNTGNYKDAVLKAVNLGQDTDTTGAVTGGLAGLLYGHESIPEHWLNQLARKDDIEDLAVRMFKAVSGI
ncbi:ADP-ribosylglycohydrolase family protein [Mucilaginibacter sp. OK098]|uniref:ADP-ribosylglycohydrolase family protein n=1 Tax=Mucilaginibacter sp. OK098 TaxID=1855297 RepID=UPI00091A0851|nr:ADP-ribosylglycohydrolase family protein [Mucilaginibacter sp. OK098]SHM90024.1 ADP-ribosylglycohydrolase [Mucilaginibacter sp. OK098]